MSTSRPVLFAYAATAVALAGAGTALAVVPPGPPRAAARGGESGAIELVSHWVWQTKCSNRKKRVCPQQRPCPIPSSKVCASGAPKRCRYETVRTCRPVRVKLPH